MQLDYSREVIPERQKSRLLKKLMITFTKYYVCSRHSFSTHRCRSGQPRALRSEWHTLSSQPSCLKMVSRWVEFSADWCKWHISDRESNSWSQKFVVESALGTMLNDVSLWVTYTLLFWCPVSLQRIVAHFFLKYVFLKSFVHRLITGDQISLSLFAG